MALSLVLMRITQRTASLTLAIVDRWLRWIVFSFGAALLCRQYGLLDRPYWVLVLVFFVVWFLAETLYNWLMITAESLSPLPLFPRYAVNSSGEEWPVQPQLMRVREWLRGQGFRQVQALKAELGPGIFLRVSVYQDAAATTRVQATFLPLASGAISVCYGVSSLTADGSRYITDNLYVPFGGYFPENWYVERRPWSRKLPAIMARHRARLETAKVELVPFASEPVMEINSAQHELDQLNTEMGFLHPHAQREDLGKFTQEGRYRVWKEIWMLNYLGRSARYL